MISQPPSVNPPYLKGGHPSQGADDLLYIFWANRYVRDKPRNIKISSRLTLERNAIGSLWVPIKMNPNVRSMYEAISIHSMMESP